MATYIEDLVQNIYTNCDMTGLDELNQGLKDAIWYSSELEQNLRRANQAQKAGFDFHAREIEKNKQVYLLKRQQNSLLNQENIYRANLAEKQLRWDEERQRRQEKYNKSLSSQNRLLNMAKRFVLGYIGFNTLRNIINTGSQLQLIKASIEGLTKSTQDWQFIQNQAWKTGTKIEVVARGYRNFYSAAKMAGFDKTGIQGMYADLLLSTRAIGATTQQTEGALLALEQMISKGTVSMEELRRQLGNALPGAFEIGAKAMNMTTMEFNKFVRTGKLASAQFVPLFIKTLKQEYASGFKDIEKTLNFAQGRLTVAWEKFTENLVSGEAGKTLAEGIMKIAEYVNSPEFAKLVHTLGTIFSWITKIVIYLLDNLPLIMLYLGYLGLTGVLGKIIQHLVAVQVATFAATGATITLGQAGVASFTAMAGAVGTFIKSFIPLIATLLLVEDLIYYIGERLFGWNANSMIGYHTNKRDAKKKLKINTVNADSDMARVMKHVDELVQSGRIDEIPKYAQSLGGVETYSGKVIPMQKRQDMNFQKEETQNVNVHIGNIVLGDMGGKMDMGNISDYQIGRGLGEVLIETGITKGAFNMAGKTPFATEGAKTMLGQKKK